MRSLGTVVVAYHAPEMLRQALSSLPPELPVFVVDNSSSTAVKAVAVECGASYDDPGRNLGFAAGVNRGVALLSADKPEADVLLLNPDAVLPFGAVETLSWALHAVPGRAAVAPALIAPDGRPQRAVWPWPSPSGAWLDASGLGRLRRGGSWLVGAVLLLNRRALDEIGGFDEDFFLYAEETDWQRRAARAGWELSLVPEVSVHHVGAGTSSDSLHRERLFHAAQETYIRKWFGGRGWATYRAAVLLGALVRAAVPGPQRASARLRLHLYVRGPQKMAAL